MSKMSMPKPHMRPNFDDEPLMTIRLRALNADQFDFLTNLLTEMGAADEDCLVNGAGYRHMAMSAGRIDIVRQIDRERRFAN